MTARLLISATAIIAIIAISPAYGQECGDVDSDNRVTATDALRVLSKAVGGDVQLECTTGDCAALEARVAQLEAAAPVVRDRSGNILGTLIGGDEYFNKLRIMSHPHRRLFTLFLGGEYKGLLGARGGRLYFDQPNCLGMAYAEDPEALTWYAGGSDSDQWPSTVFWHTTGAPPLVMTAYSVVTNEYGECDNLSSPLSKQGWPAQRVQPPFPVPVELPITFD